MLSVSLFRYHEVKVVKVRNIVTNTKLTVKWKGVSGSGLWRLTPLSTIYQ